MHKQRRQKYDKTLIVMLKNVRIMQITAVSSEKSM